VETSQFVINVGKRKFNIFCEQLHVTFVEKVCHLTWHHFITIKICFWFNKKLSIKKMYQHPLSCGCAFQSKHFCVLFWFIVYQGESFHEKYIASVLKELEEENVSFNKSKWSMVCAFHYCLDVTSKHD
jgi:hypothetical protein